MDNNSFYFVARFMLSELDFINETTITALFLYVNSP